MSTKLGDSPHLLVPVHIDALLVGKKPRFSWGNLAPNYTKLSKNFYVGADLRDLFGDQKDLLQKGLHLHFRLPAALTHGISSAGSGELEFPVLPNRWLVLRYYRNESNSKFLSRTWIIRSDAEGPDDAVPWPVLLGRMEDGPLRIRPTGKCEELSESPFSENDTPAEVKITAVGNGDVGFSAHYPACRSILGFYDRLEDVPAGTELSYLVTGWYSAASDDPSHTFVNDLKSELDDQGRLGALKQWLRDRGWSAEGLNAAQIPSRMICHGLVRSVDWKGTEFDYSDVEEFNGFNEPSEFSVDVGNSSAEALASRLALLAATPTSSDPELFEDVLTAFQTGLLCHGPNIVELDAELHGQGFVPVVSGKTFVIQPEASAPEPADVAQPDEPLPLHLQELLRNLNACQRECDRLDQLLTDYHWELYALWHRMIDKSKKRKKTEAALLKSNLDGLQSFLQNYDNLPAVIAARRRCQDAEEVLKQELAKETLPRQSNGVTVHAPKYRLTSSAADRFFVPNDPVVLISGPALERKGTYTPALHDTLPCRVTGQEVQEYTYDIRNGRHGIVVTAASRIESLKIDRATIAVLPDFARRLFSEAILLEEIEQAGSQAGDIGWRTRPAFPQRSLPRISGRMPAAISLFDWEHNPWIPVYLAWQAEWFSDYTLADSGNLAHNTVDAKWRLGGGGESVTSDDWKYRRRLDLMPIEPPAEPSTTSQKYKGYALLARPSFLALAEKLSKEPDKVPPGVKKIAGPLQALLTNRPMLSQALAGFHDALIMRRAGDQLPPLDYDRFAGKGPDRKKFFVDRIHEALRPQDRFDCSPAPSYPFFPIRAGRLKVSKLTIIDAFGQKVELKSGSATQIHISQRLDSRRAEASATDSAFQMRPRFMRPMRLAFTPAPAGNPDAIAPASSPICGWVVPNQFDQNLTLYAANGKPLGALQKKFELKAGSQQPFFYWVDVPGTEDWLIGQEDSHLQGDESGNLPPSLIMHLEEKIENTHLRHFAGFALGLNGDCGGAFDSLIDRALAATEQRVPEEDPGVSVLIGRPLALVRAEIGLEVPGLPALDQSTSWRESDTPVQRILEANGLESFPQDERCKDLLQTGDVENVRWPVRLGGRHSYNDGLVGFFAPSESATAIRPFYASWGFGGTHYPNVLEYAQDLALNCHRPIHVTLLMDPQARVHATSGVLPRAFLELPPSATAGAKGAREVFFQTSPVLGAPASPQIPKPSDDYGEWTWAYRPDVTQWAEHADLVSASDRGGFSDTWPSISEGWLKLKIDPVQVLGLWLRNAAPELRQVNDYTLAWSVRGAKSLQLFDTTKERTLIKHWSHAPLPREWTISETPSGATYELVALDEAGYQDRKEIKIQPRTSE